MAVVNISRNQIAYSIMEFYRANVLNTDDIDIRWIKFLVDDVRAKLLKQRLDKPMSVIDNHYVQKIRPSGQAVEVETVDSSAYTSTASERYMSRTSISIPTTIELSWRNHCFTRIGPADSLSEGFNVIEYDHALVYGNGKFNKNTIAAFLLDDRIYFVSGNSQVINGLKYVDIRGVFQSPAAAALISDSSYTDDDDYPVNRGLSEDIKSFILAKQFGLSYKPPIDTDEVNVDIVKGNM